MVAGLLATACLLNAIPLPDLGARENDSGLAIVTSHSSPVAELAFTVKAQQESALLRSKQTGLMTMLPLVGQLLYHTRPWFSSAAVPVAASSSASLDNFLWSIRLQN